ncbi:hypothetical protein VCRA2114E365_20061 [Vibrio crassostreae]|nr:hypothetical protein VCHA40O235_10768 [Vibrio chagasii]CAK1826302.1 hypothetical protein VCRA2117O378_10062 [Vibrio crassostreae]CAK1871956.1 hypothetical protein VCRA2113O356_10425 [Vibrio crassostreae]CAK1982300.1 hypothetical protein VCRA2117O376_20063 [Vibrio crassostreae]CAK1984857.1 hypothetical protein VCRA2113O357_20062 [Vibrio crassostreae]
MLIWVPNGLVFLNLYPEIILLITFLDARLRYSVPNAIFNFQETAAF